MLRAGPDGTPPTDLPGLPKGPACLPAYREALRDAFASLSTYEGVTGKLTYRGGSPDPIKSVVMKQFKGKKAVFVTNIDPY